jgi:acyl-CoA synthetase (AMP-forming)/AMP-acid ligase II
MTLRNRAVMSPELEAVVTAEVRWTYREFNERVNRLAHFLLECGIRKGDRVALLCLTDHPFATIFMATAKIGAIAVPLNYRLQPAELEEIAEDSSLKFFSTTVNFRTR